MMVSSWLNARSNANLRPSHEPWMTDMDHHKDWLRRMGWDGCWEVRTHRPQEAHRWSEDREEIFDAENVSKDPKTRSDCDNLQVQGID